MIEICTKHKINLQTRIMKLNLSNFHGYAFLMDLSHNKCGKQAFENNSLFQNGANHLFNLTSNPMLMIFFSSSIISAMFGGMLNILKVLCGVSGSTFQKLTFNSWHMPGDCTGGTESVSMTMAGVTAIDLL